MLFVSAKHESLRRKKKGGLYQNEDNVSEWGDMFTRGLLFQSASTLKIKPCWFSAKGTSSSSH